MTDIVLTRKSSEINDNVFSRNGVGEIIRENENSWIVYVPTGNYYRPISRSKEYEVVYQNLLIEEAKLMNCL